MQQLQHVKKPVQKTDDFKPIEQKQENNKTQKKENEYQELIDRISPKESLASIQTNSIV
jgi:hypothetical protein